MLRSSFEEIIISVGISNVISCSQVIPFLVLAVGVDNIFILVQTHQRTPRLEGESYEEHIARVLSKAGPSILLTSLSESTCFLLGKFDFVLLCTHVLTLHSISSYIIYLLIVRGFQVVCPICLPSKRLPYTLEWPYFWISCSKLLVLSVSFR